jgi:hypothetical protein
MSQNSVGDRPAASYKRHEIEIEWKNVRLSITAKPICCPFGIIVDITHL